MTRRQWYVYFLLRNKKIVYVGMSCRIGSRVPCHFRDKEFTSIRWIKCKSKSKAVRYERRWIMKFIPEYNNDILLKIKKRKMGLIKKHLPKFSVDLLKGIEKKTGVPFDELLKHPLAQSLYQYEK